MPVSLLEELSQTAQGVPLDPARYVMALFKLMTALLPALLLTSANAGNRAARQLYLYKLPSIQYYFVNKVHNGPVADAGLIDSSPET